MIEAHLNSIYTFSFVLGLGFAVLSAVFSAFSGDGHHCAHDVSDITHAQHDISAHTTAHSDSNLAHLSPTSPMTLSVFATSFGGFGLCWQRVFAMNFALLGVVSGVIFGLIAAAFTFYVFALIFKETQSTSNVNIADLIGTAGSLAVGITNENPIGQIVFEAKGRRQTAMARSIDGKPIEKNRRVSIIKADKDYMYVQE